MDKRISKLKRFIDKYGEDFLEDGTKTRIVNSLELQTENILTLRRMILKEKDKNPLFNGWEI